MCTGEANWIVIRSLLYSLSIQLDRSIESPIATVRETAQSRRTKALVLDFDRWAFEQCGTLQSGRDAREGGSFGDEVTSSIAALAQDFSLWGIILLEDVL